MNVIKKLFSVPVSNETKTIEVAQLWEVRWIACNNRDWAGDKYTDPREEVECFLSEKEAQEFAKSLANALKLRREVRGTDITVTKAQ